MRFYSRLILPFSFAFGLGSAIGPAVAQSPGTVAASAADSFKVISPAVDTGTLVNAFPAELGSASLPDAPQAQSSSSSATVPQSSTNPAPAPKQTKRILFIIPNFRAVSADVKLPPTTTGEKFKIFLSDSFDYSGFVEVALLAGDADAHKSEPEFQHGAAAYARYYWHSFADNTDGNLMTEFLVPTASREDPRYYTLGHGGFLHRSVYSISRLIITRDNHGNATPNFSEIVGNGAAAGISNFYYPSPDRTWTKTGQRWILQVGIDGVANLVKEFWPNINDKVFHDKY
jgi:hypothetical protein